MKNEEAFEIIKNTFSRELWIAGSNTFSYNAYNAQFSFVVRELKYTYAEIFSWNEPALFVSKAEILDTNKSYTIIYYTMKCGTIVWFCASKAIFKGAKLPLGISYKPLADEPGWKIPIEHWTVMHSL